MVPDESTFQAPAIVSGGPHRLARSFQQSHTPIHLDFSLLPTPFQVWVSDLRSWIVQPKRLPYLLAAPVRPRKLVLIQIHSKVFR